MVKFHIKLSEGHHKDPEFEVSCDFEADTSDKEKAEQIINETMRQLLSLENGLSYPSQKKTNALGFISSQVSPVPDQDDSETNLG